MIFIPSNADFMDTETAISYDRVAGNVAGTLMYSYGGRAVGAADVITTGASGATYEFGEISGRSGESSAEAETLKDGNSGAQKTSSPDRKINGRLVKRIVLAVVIVIAAGIAALFLYNNIRRIIRRKNRKNGKYKTIRENRKWRKRRRRR